LWNLMQYSPASYYLVTSRTTFSGLLLFGEILHNILQPSTFWWNLLQYSPASYYLAKPYTIVSSLLLLGETSHNILPPPNIC